MTTLKSSSTPPLRCFIIAPADEKYAEVVREIRKATTLAGFEVMSREDLPVASISDSWISESLSLADCVLAEVTEPTPSIMFEIGIAKAMMKPIGLFAGGHSVKNLPRDLSRFRVVQYPAQMDPERFKRFFQRETEVLLRDFKRQLSQARAVFYRGRPSESFLVDWNQLDAVESDNLLHELLQQMGFTQVSWAETAPFADLVAELPRKDPDGFEYRELWVVAKANKLTPDLLEMAQIDRDFFLHRTLRGGRENSLVERENSTATLLIVSFDKETPGNLLARVDRQGRLRPKTHGRAGMRIRVWTRDYLTQLVQQFPQLGSKYFSEEVRSRDSYRKSLSELYSENVTLAEAQAALISDLENEKQKRVSAERDAAWKEISFAAAHKLGNPIFAIETNLTPLRLRVESGRTKEALAVTDEIGVSVEKAKEIVDQFKSLTRIQEMSPRATPLRPLLEHSCDVAIRNGFVCTIECPGSLELHVDPVRLAECIDELVSNAVQWRARALPSIAVTAASIAAEELPSFLPVGHSYAKLRFSDNGEGIPTRDKVRIFDAFFSTRDQGTGLGLAIVKRIVEGHGGAISEVGVPSEGAIFELLLPIEDRDRGGIGSKRTAVLMSKRAITRGTRR